MLFIIIVDTLPSLPACSDNEITTFLVLIKALLSLQIQMMTTHQMVHLIFNTIIHNIQNSICAKTM